MLTESDSTHCNERFTAIQTAIKRFILRQKHDVHKGVVNGRFMSWLLNINGEGNQESGKRFKPFNQLKGVTRKFQDLTEKDLTMLGVSVGKGVSLLFTSGIEVRGIVTEVIRENDKTIQVTFRDCFVTYEDEVLFDPNCGLYHLSVEETIPMFCLHDHLNSHSGNNTLTTLSRLNDLYEQIRGVRTGIQTAGIVVIAAVWEELKKTDKYDWLLRLEMVEILQERNWLPEVRNEIECDLERIKVQDEKFYLVIKSGLDVCK
ncbi:hypothetical protein LGQ02_01905 [Bacillus shivajii]|uniref:hypothetical protein n=1 Tax=Bacillus shivajii TaxID=1983719 RepID=UPI001CF9C5D5|nr:hypothetical protein [Bacillus shivajii]UCZ53576.1 hypothetical protein LGQ02_01905 [Bacillus shivajii]